MKQVIISIGREYGSAGLVLAEKLAEHYGLKLYDSNLLQEIAAEKKLNGEDLSEFDEKRHNKFLYRTVRNMNSSPEDNVANIQFNYLKERAKAGDSFVVVGRCAETILKEYPGLISIFVTGDMAAKMKRVEALYGLTGKKAERFILENNFKRKMYHNSHCNKTWGDSRNYDISINNTRLGVDGTAQILIQYIDARRALLEQQG